MGDDDEDDDDDDDDDEDEVEEDITDQIGREIASQIFLNYGDLFEDGKEGGEGITEIPLGEINFTSSSSSSGKSSSGSSSSRSSEPLDETIPPAMRKRIEEAVRLDSCHHFFSLSFLWNSAVVDTSKRKNLQYVRSASVHVPSQNAGRAESARRGERSGWEVFGGSSSRRTDPNGTLFSPLVALRHARRLSSNNP